MKVEEQPQEPLPAPEKELLARAQRAFEDGDYRAVRKLTAALVRSADSEVARDAQRLKNQIAADPVAVAVLIGCCVILAVIAAIYLLIK
jgi:isocitrate dehydrogenase kinase/phosphatase